MTTRKTNSALSLASEDDMYSGYNDYCPALATADIRQHGIGVLYPDSEGSRQSTPRPISSKFPRTSLTPQNQSIQGRESFRGFRRLSESRWVGTPGGSVSGSGTPWSVETLRCRTDHGRTSYSSLGSTPRPRTDCARRTGTASRLSDVSRRTTPFPSRRSGTAQDHRPRTPNGRPPTSYQDTPRPLSTIRAAYYLPDSRASTTSSSRRTASDQTRMSSNFRSPAPLIQKENSPVQEMKLLEMQLSELFLECRQALDSETALEIAKQAQEKERRLYRIYTSEDHKFPYNTSLTFAVIMNLANQYEANAMYKEALNSYQIINKSNSSVFVQPFRVKINMGNLYVKLCQYPLAVKTYRMALDHVPHEFGFLRVKILRNLGVVFLKTNQLVDAINTFTNIMEEKPGFVEGLNLMACLYALNCEDDMKTCFEMLLATPLEITEDEKYGVWDMKRDVDAKCLKDTLKYDNLSKLERKLKMEADNIILLSAKVVANSICETIFDGYDWCIEKMKSSQFAYLVDEIQITKATKLMNEAQLAPAITLLKDLQHGSEAVTSAAATNLAFIYLTQQELDEAEKYSAIACATDCYSSAALVNSGCCFMARGLDSLAKTKFAFAVENDATCFEALYDLGLANKKMGLYVEAMCSFSKLHAMFREDALVLYQLASLLEMTGDLENAMTRYQQILCLEPKNAFILKKIGKLFDETGDVYQAYQYYLDSHRLLPSQVDVIIWLSIYTLNSGRPADQAIKYINLAIQCQPYEVKWHLMVASCHERSGNLRKAKEHYEEIHTQFPDNTECLRHLVKICMTMNTHKAKEYALDLKKLEKKMLSGNRRPSAFSSSSSDVLQVSPEMFPPHGGCLAQTHYESNYPLNEFMYDAVDRMPSNVSSNGYYSFENSHTQLMAGLITDTLFTTPRNTENKLNKSHQTVLRNESLLRSESDYECAVDGSKEFCDRIYYNPHLLRWLNSNDRFDAKKLSQPQEHRFVEGVPSDSTCSSTEPGCRGYVAITPRMLFTKIQGDPLVHNSMRMRERESKTIAQELVRRLTGDSPVVACDSLRMREDSPEFANDSLCMSEGDSQVDLLESHFVCRPTLRSTRVSSRIDSYDVGLKMFADSGLGADLLPN